MELSAHASQNEFEQCANEAAAAYVNSVGSRFKWSLFLSRRHSRMDGGGSVYWLVDHTSERREAVLNGPVLLPTSAVYRVKSPKICHLYGCLMSKPLIRFKL